VVLGERKPPSEVELQFAKTSEKLKTISERKVKERNIKYPGFKR